MTLNSFPDSDPAGKTFGINGVLTAISYMSALVSRMPVTYRLVPPPPPCCSRCLVGISIPDWLVGQEGSRDHDHL